MSTHHKQTALRYLDQTLTDGGKAIVHAQLETAAQIERVADTLQDIMRTIAEIGAFALQSGMVDVKLPEPNFYEADKPPDRPGRH